MDEIIRIGAAVVAALIGIFMWRKRGKRNDRASAPPVVPAGHAARREAARQAQEDATRDKLKEVDGRPDTGDARADLDERLDR